MNNKVKNTSVESNSVQETTSRLSKFYELIAVIISKKEYRDVLHSLRVEHTCRNCTSYCCGGRTEEQAEDCIKWYSSTLANKLRDLKTDNPMRFYELITMIISKEKQTDMTEWLQTKHTCQNCTSYCSGGRTEEQAENCRKWSNDKMIRMVYNQK